ncbi:putative major facilitator superfamily transporter [Rosellinia necatrix]|uniref:Putative major facilitator superfamily transporter n=1 Tax=Rosellinia necatrix TaxID=77044 RepID=A0A1W2TMZ2_ROSNE|nr:putative major facilitator superfamily transporter [Rosellinia necatrix]
MALKTRLREYFRNDYQPGEKQLVRKIDFFILTFCCLSYFTNYLDRSNLNNAYVSGMKEELHFVGDQLNQVQAAFTSGYIVGQIPANLSLHYVRPRIFFPACMVVWAALTMVTAAARNPQGVAAIRFFQGVAEATTFVGTHYILGSWYTERELGKRSGIFTSSGLAGTMLGGYIQAGIQSSLNGRHGLSGWRWLFIIDGLITLPVAVYGFLFFPDTPATTRAFYLSPAQRALAVSRVPRVAAATAGGRAPWTWAFARRALTSRLLWGFVVLWALAGETEAFGSNGLLGLYLKAHPVHRYTVAQLNNYPTGVPAAGIVSTLFWATLTDFLGGRRDLVVYFVGATGVATASLILAAASSARGAGGLDAARSTTPMVFGAYYWAGAVYACQATCFAWANDALRHEDHMFRAVVLAGMNLGSNVLHAWWTIVFYGASMAPWFTRGMWAMIAVSIAVTIWTAGLSYYTARLKREREAETPIDNNAQCAEKEVLA